MGAQYLAGIPLTLTGAGFNRVDLENGRLLASGEGNVIEGATFDFDNAMVYANNALTADFGQRVLCSASGYETFQWDAEGGVTINTGTSGGSAAFNVNDAFNSGIAGQYYPESSTWSFSDYLGGSSFALGEGDFSVNTQNEITLATSGNGSIQLDSSNGQIVLDAAYGVVIDAASNNVITSDGQGNLNASTLRAVAANAGVGPSFAVFLGPLAGDPNSTLLLAVVAGSFYFRSDTPTTALQRVYVFNGTTWTGII